MFAFQVDQHVLCVCVCTDVVQLSLDMMCYTEYRERKIRMQFGMFIAQWAAARLPARAHCSSTLYDVQCDDTFVHCRLHICVMCHSERKRHKLRAKGISTLHYRFLKLLNGFISSKQWIEFKDIFRVCGFCI